MKKYKFLTEKDCKDLEFLGEEGFTDALDSLVREATNQGWWGGIADTLIGIAIVGSVGAISINVYRWIKK